MSIDQPFTWHECNAESHLPPRWQKEVIAVAAKYAVGRVLRPSHATSREAATVTELPILTVPGEAVEQRLPWITPLYEGIFQLLGQSAMSKTLFTGVDIRHRLALNVQRRNPHHPEGGRYEAHVDTNPVEALLFATTHSRDQGGTLVVANDVKASDIDKIEANATRIDPVAGKLIFFDATNHPHYVSQLAHPDDLRVVIAMNYYTEQVTEAQRDPTLDAYLEGRMHDV